MKVTLAALALAAAGTAFAEPTVSIQGVRDTRYDNVTGYSLGISAPVAGIKLVGKFDNVYGAPGTNYDSLYGGVEKEVASFKGIRLGLSGGVGYLETPVGNGHFGRVGTTVSYNFRPDLNAYIGGERTLGASAVNSLDATEGFVGADYSLNKQFQLNGKVTFGDGIPGAKYQGGVSYKF